MKGNKITKNKEEKLELKQNVRGFYDLFCHRIRPTD